MEGNSKLGRLLLNEKAKKNKETKYSARRGCHIKKKRGGRIKGEKNMHWRGERKEGQEKEDFIFRGMGFRRKKKR